MLQILNIQLFVLGGYISSKTKTGDVKRLGKRITMKHEAMNAEGLIRSEIDGKKGRTVVSRKSLICFNIFDTCISRWYDNIVCNNDETGNKIREAVRKLLDKTIDLKELEYRPSRRSSDKVKKEREGRF